ncbi:CHAT domain-containing protein [Pengzhenrongella sicca]|uniref:CHAT domain-containing protein n=1 Tax=Pengzhenrongella sicca TaxID=2819238 RepID=A0A8A4ZGF0_9MICO|nr:CHAT domain-containing protein [Pengzhenrongella sicca]QTE29606.1 CHAT domain-containing protein [Pengzhenrongella sicca]
MVEALPGVDRHVLGRFRDAVLAGEAAALTAWAATTTAVRELLPMASADVQGAFAAGDRASARRDAPVVAALARTVGDAQTAAVAHVVCARAAFSMGDLTTTIDEYRRALTLDGTAARLRCVVHDNLGLALTRRGRDDDLDAAVREFSKAKALAATAAETAAVRGNRADALEALGWLDLAVVERRAVVSIGREQGAPRHQLAIALDNYAFALQRSGQLDDALEPLAEAAATFPAQDLADRCTNAVARQTVLAELGRTREAAAAFHEARALAREAAEAMFDPAHFRDGLARALAECPEPPAEAISWLLTGVALRAEERPDDAAAAFGRAAQLAGQAGDHLTRLRSAANAAALYADFGDSRRAVDLCRQVRGEALERGLAAPAAMATGTLATLADSGVAADSTPELALLAQSLLLDTLGRRLLGEAQLPADHFEVQVSRQRTGKLEVGMASVARAAGADDLAEHYLRESLRAALDADAPMETLNRSAGLLDLLSGAGRDRPEARDEAALIAADLERRLASGGLPAQGELVARRALAAFVGPDDPRAVEHLWAAAEAYEQLRAGMDDPDRREGLDRAHRVVPSLVSAMLANSRPAEELLGALQHGRARRLLDLLATRSGLPATPLDGAAVRALIAARGADEALVEVTAVRDGLLALVVTPQAVRSVHVPGDVDDLVRAQWGDSERRANETVRTVAGSAILAELAAGVEALLAPRTRILVVTDDLLANLPLHVVPVDGVAWGERRPYGRVPAAGVLLHTPADRAWRGAALVAGNSAGDLEGAAGECRDIAAMLGVPAVLGADCSLDTLRTGLVTDLDVVHLAVHGRADVRRGGRSSLLLASGPAGGVVWTPFEELAALPWRAQVIVFSGCSTAVGGPRDGVGLYGVAQAAAEAGATTVLASLWPVDDMAARQLMTTLYAALVRRRDAGEETADLRDLLRDATSAVSGGGGSPKRSSRDFGLPAEDLVLPPLPVAAASVEEAKQRGAFVVLGEPTVRLAAGAAAPIP